MERPHYFLYAVLCLSVYLKKTDTSLCLYIGNDLAKRERVDDPEERVAEENRMELL
jgi:hypothetical protein